MTKKLGFWNRLAVVLVALSVLIVPPAAMLSVAQEMVEADKARYELCDKQAIELSADLDEQLSAQAKCSDDFINRPGVGRVWTWANWREFTLGTLAFCVVAYMLLLVGTQTVKWIWRGKKV